MTDLSSPPALSGWSAQWAGLEVVVVGLEAVAFSVVDTLTELGAVVRVIASEPVDQYVQLLSVVGASLAIDPAGAQLVIATALTPADDPTVLWARENGVPVWGDVEFAWRVRDKVRAADWLCVAADGDAAAAVDLAVHLIAAAGTRVAGVGHGNVPILDAVRDPQGFEVLVVELSDADLVWAESSPVSPLASLVTAGTDELLGRVYANTRLACIYDKAQPEIIRMVEEAEVVEGCRAVGFDLGTPGPSDLGLVGDIVVDRAFHDARRSEALELTTHGELAAAGLGDPVSVSTVLAASALARAVGVAPEVVGAAIATFRAARP